MSTKLLVLVCLVCAVVTQAASAGTITVAVGGGGDHEAIQPALDAAAEGDTVLVMPGTYAGEDNTVLDFAGTDVELRSANGAAETIIDCGNDATAFDIRDDDAGPACIIDGFTLTNGDRFSGGLVYCIYSSPTFIDCVFTSSFAYYGGAVYLYDSEASFTGCVFTGNTSEHGGAVQVERCSPAFTNCEFTLNTSTGEAGAIDCIWEASPTFIGCTISDNSAGSQGGGIRCYDHSSPTLTDCDLIGNSATSLGGGAFCDSTSAPTMTDCRLTSNTALIGAGMACLGNSDPTVIDCTFRDGTAPNGAGGVYTDYSSPTFDGCSFLDNTGQYGGGAYVYESSSTFTDCVFLRNYATNRSSDGGGIYIDRSATELTNCTFSDNGADTGGGSVHLWLADPVLTNCIIAFSTLGPAVFCEAGTESPTFICCDIFGNAGGDWVGCIADQATVGNNMSEDPLFCDRPGDDLTIYATSGCAEAHNPACGLIGALDVGCDSPVRPASWGSIKAMYR